MVAIEFGLLTAACLFVKRMVDVTHIRPWTKADETNENDNGRLKKIPENTQVFEIDGPMFFANSDIISSIPIKEGVKVVILRMRNIPSLDVSALRAITTVLKYCQNKNITMLFSHVNKQPMSVMKKAGFIEKAGVENFLPNIDEALKKAEEIV